MFISEGDERLDVVMTLSAALVAAKRLPLCNEIGEFLLKGSCLIKTFHEVCGVRSSFFGRLPAKKWKICLNKKIRKVHLHEATAVFK